jgi:hypothetical protein
MKTQLKDKLYYSIGEVADAFGKRNLTKFNLKRTPKAIGNLPIKTSQPLS